MHTEVIKTLVQPFIHTVYIIIYTLYIGTGGIVLQETQNTFKLRTSDNRLKSKKNIPSAQLVLTFDPHHVAAVPKAKWAASYYYFSLYGNHLRFVLERGLPGRHIICNPCQNNYTSYCLYTCTVGSILTRYKSKDKPDT